MGIEAYGGPFSFRLEDGFVLSDVSYLPLVNSLHRACSLNWLSRKPVILDFLNEIFFISIIDIVNPYDVSVCH